MKELFNYSYVPGYEDEEGLRSFVSAMDLSGIELYMYENLAVPSWFTPYVVGVHLRFFPSWVALWRNDVEELRRQEAYSDLELQQLMGVSSREELIAKLRKNITCALRLEPEYLVWHVADCSLSASYTRYYPYKDEEVVDATAELYREVCDLLPGNVTVLFENLWWAGLTLTRKNIVRRLLEATEGKCGLMLDTGHLLNTNFNLTTEQEAVEYLLQKLRALGLFRQYIKGVHFNYSLSGSYVRETKRRGAPKWVSLADNLKHINNIDQHRPFTGEAIKRIEALLSPNYLVHELYYGDLAQMGKFISTQRKALGIFW